MTISHIFFDDKTKEWHIQSNEEHQQGVAQLAEQFGTVFGCGDICRLIGLLHDKGKEQNEFQKYIKLKSGYDTTIKYTGHPEHAYVGALITQKIFGNNGYLPGLIISSHHTGLKNSTDYTNILSRELPKDVVLPSYTGTKLSLGMNLKKSDVHHLVRMLFSCLVDADFLDTETFMNGQSRKEVVGNQSTMPELLCMLENYLKQFGNKPKFEINAIRSQIQTICRDKATSSQGFYSLTVPTGGGKTLSGLLWALRHAVEHNLMRVIIAIPYTSIIAQTAKILRDIFGSSNVLEHHSAFDANEYCSEDMDNDKFAMQQRLASENWDYPIVVTTNVQLFQSMMASKSSRCRKLHNIAHSVIILDEAQMLPIQHLQPIIDTLYTYQHLFGCSVLLTTASQPVLTQDYIGKVTEKLKGLDNVIEIIPASMDLHNRLKRVQLHFIDHAMSYDNIVNEIIRHNQVLCIVNTRRDALEIFTRLPQDGISNFHLSRMMCTEHLSKTIDEVRQALKEGRPIRVVATQLIEAGVDVDFETVMRQEAGLDSILQAAGRCNREGKMHIGDTYVFKLDKPLPRGFISNANNARLAINAGDSINWFAPETMTKYFSQLYSRFDNFDKSDIKGMLYDVANMQFENAEKEFSLIEDSGINVIVNYKTSPQLVEKLKFAGPSYNLRKQLSRYTITINPRDFKELQGFGLIDEIYPGIFYISDISQYNELTGLSLNNHWLNEIQII